MNLILRSEAVGFLSSWGYMVIVVSIISSIVTAYYSLTLANSLGGSFSAFLLLLSAFLLTTGVYIGYLGIKVEELGSPGISYSVETPRQPYQPSLANVERLALEMEELNRMQGGRASPVVAGLMRLCESVQALQLSAGVEAGLLEPLRMSLRSLKSGDREKAENEIDSFVKIANYQQDKPELQALVREAQEIRKELEPFQPS